MMISVSKTKLPQVGRASSSESHTDEKSPVSPKDSGGGVKLRNPSYPYTKLYVATYNILTMRKSEHLDGLEKELSTIKWDVLGLSETRLPGEKCTTLNSGHILYQKNAEENDHVGGVAILINKKLKHLVTKMNSISNRVIYIVLQISKRYSVQIIQAYAPTSTADEEVMNNFYDDITIARKSEQTHFCLIIGDLNAKIGTRTDNIENIGKFGIGRRNDRGEELLTYLQSEGLYCMNTFFKKKLKRKWTWRSPDGTTKNEIDFIISTHKYIITDVSVLNSFHTGSDHRLVRAEVRINTKQERNKMICKHVNPTRTDLSQYQDKYQVELERKLTSVRKEQETTLDKMSEKITESINTAVRKIVTRNKTSKNKKISKETTILIERRRKLNRGTQEYREICRSINQGIRKDTRSYNTKMITETIENNKNMKILKSQLTSGKGRLSKIKDENGTIITEKVGISRVIANFYTDLYSSRNLSPIDLSTNSKITNVNSEEIPEITTFEIEKALKSMKNGRSPGEDRITTEMIKFGGETLFKEIKELLNRCLTEGKIPANWRNAEVILIYKKGDAADIENYRPISLLSQLYKLFTRIVTSRLTNKLDFYQPVEQAGFRKGYGTTDHLQAVRTLIEKCEEYNVPLHMCFVDFKKAFDTVELWAIVQALNGARVDSRYTTLIRDIYENATSMIKINEETYTPKISINRGVRQGDPMSPKLFTAALENIFKKLNWNNCGINIEGKRLSHLRFADDIVLFSEDSDELEEMMRQLNEAAKTIGLEMNLNKTKVVSNSMKRFSVETEHIEVVEEYIYLGHIIKLGKQNQTAEINRRIRLSWTAFSKVKDILKNKEVPNCMKKKVFNSCILPVMAYGLETMTLTEKSAERMRIAQRAMERAMLGISRRDRINNIEIRNRTKITDIMQRVATQKWSWIGHVARKTPDQWSNRIMQWRPRAYKRSVGRPQKRWADDIKAFAGNRWYQIAQDRVAWRSLEEAYVQQWTVQG